MSAELIQKLQDPNLYDHPVKCFKVLETHISWVILTGDYAYKIKKPHDFEFLNFTTLEKRKHYCELELALNKKLAPEIYLNVLPITGSAQSPAINGQGNIIEYALKMREFSQANMFNHLLEQKQLSKAHISEVATTLAKFHNDTERDSPEYFGTPEQVFEAVMQNFDQIRPLLSDKNDLDILAKLETWTRQEHERILPTLTQRKQQGFIRACHGDVHLGNITLFKDKPVIFDCIEFNESFRWTDVMADTGFLMMDLHQHKQRALANIFLNQYLIESGDYAGLNILPYYQAYRAMVRAKICLFERMQHSEASEKANDLLKKYRDFIQLVTNYSKPQNPYLIINHGFSGTGKSTVAEILVEELSLIQLRSDIERKRLHGLTASDKSHSGLYADMYAENITDKTYQHLLELAKTNLSAGYATIVDATFLKEKYRNQFKQLATALELPFIILHIHAPMELLQQWIDERQQKTSISEADKEVLLAQQEHIDALTGAEMEYVIDINTAHELDQSEILKSIQNKIKQVEIS